MFPLFNALLAPFVPALWLYTLHRRFIQRKSHMSFQAQWGHITPEMREFGGQNGPKIWLHAVSVGETMAAKPIARALKSDIPGLQIALSGSTDTGHQIAETLLKNGEVDCVFYFPLDLAPIQSRVLSALGPDAICLVETELWPNLLHLARRKNIPTFLVNGRVSDNLLQTAPKLGPLWKWMSGNVTQFLMRGEVDAVRLRALGVSPQKICVTGDVKLEAPPTLSEALRRKWRDELGLDEGDRVLICGSTHEGQHESEEESLLRIAAQRPEWKIAFAPRHPQRFDEVAEAIGDSGFPLIRRSENRKWESGAVFLLDSVGELGDFYALGDAAFVGGSLVRRGGHNLLEPVLRGVPVGFGPHVRNFVAQSELLLGQGLGTRLEFETEISAWLDGISFDRAEFAAKVERALSPHRGAAHAIAQQVHEEMNRRDAKTQRK